MTDQHLDLRPVAPGTLHFADGVEKIRVDIVILDDASGLGDLFFQLWILSGSGVGGAMLNVELL